MARTFDKTIELVERLKTIDSTCLMFRSLLAVLYPEDKLTVVEDLLNYVVKKEAEEQSA